MSDIICYKVYPLIIFERMLSIISVITLCIWNVYDAVFIPYVDKMKIIHKIKKITQFLFTNWFYFILIGRELLWHLPFNPFVWRVRMVKASSQVSVSLSRGFMYVPMIFLDSRSYCEKCPSSRESDDEKKKTKGENVPCPKIWNPDIKWQKFLAW